MGRLSIFNRWLAGAIASYCAAACFAACFGTGGSAWAEEPAPLPALPRTDNIQPLPPIPPKPPTTPKAPVKDAEFVLPIAAQQVVTPQAPTAPPMLPAMATP